MVKKVKKFLVFILFSFFYSLLAGKLAEAANGNNKICIVPKNKINSHLLYDGKDTGKDALTVGTSGDCLNYN